MKEYELQVLKMMPRETETYLCSLRCITDKTICNMMNVYFESVGYVVIKLLEKIEWPASLEVETDISIPVRLREVTNAV